MAWDASFDAFNLFIIWPYMYDMYYNRVIILQSMDFWIEKIAAPHTVKLVKTCQKRKSRGHLEGPEGARDLIE